MDEELGGAGGTARRCELALVADADWALAERRLASIERLLRAPKPGRALVEQEARLLGVSWVRVYDWLRRYRANPTIEALLPKARGPAKGSARLPAETEAIIAAAIDEFFLRREKPKIKALVGEVARRCRKAGIARVPDYRTVKARLERLPLSVRVLAREGKKAAEDAFRPVTQRFDADYPLEIVQFDHTLVDVIVVDEVHRLPLQRPWLTLGIDLASRAITGFYLTLEAPSSLSIAMALTHSVLPKETWAAARGIAAPWPVAGLPGRIHLDNAREFHGKALARGCRDYGIELQFRPPGTPHFGGHIERLMGTMMGAVHLLPGTTFSNVAEKGDYDSEAKAVMTLRELETWAAVQVIVYNGSVHRQTLLPPIAAWSEMLSRRPEPPRQPRDETRFLLDFLPFEMRMVRRDGIRMFNIHYWDDVLSLWAGQSKQRMMVRYDPRDLSRVFLAGPDGRFHPISCRDLRRPRITLWEHQHAREQLRQRGIAVMDEQMLFDAVEAQRQIVAEAGVRTKSARRAGQRTDYALAAAAPAMDRGAGVTDGTAATDPVEVRLQKLGSGAPDLPFTVEEWS